MSLPVLIDEAGRVSSAATTARVRDDDSALAATVALLSRPEAYSEGTESVSVVQTHISWVFLTDRHAYKLKKPLRTEYLDFTTLEARRLDCLAEVRLNRRLARDVYLGVVPLGADPSGAVHLGGAGRPVDWLVKMRRLPADRSLDCVLARGPVPPGELAPAARLLAGFYRNAPAQSLPPRAYRERLERDVEADLRGLAATENGPGDTTSDIAVALWWFFERDGDLLEARAAAGRILDGHGDLRPEHVYLGPEPAIIDCVEYDRALRMLDPLEELASLAMECERLRADPAVAGTFLECYADADAEQPASALLDFYACRRALLRARLTWLHAREPAPRTPAYWIETAKGYLALARGHAAALG